MPFEGGREQFKERFALLSNRVPTLPTSIRRFVTLGSAVLVSLSAGTNYVFSAYSPQLAERLHMSSTALNGIGIAGNLGMYVCGPLAGKYVDSKGPRQPLAVGSALLLIGYGTVWRIYSNPPPLDHSTSAPTGTIALLDIGMFLTGAGSCATVTAGANGVAKSFGPAHRATAMAVVLAGFGLSAFLWAMMSHLFFSDDTAAFLLLLALGTSICTMVCAFGVKVVPPDADKPIGPGGSVRSKAQAGYRRLPEGEAETDRRRSLPSPKTRKIQLADLPSPASRDDMPLPESDNPLKRRNSELSEDDGLEEQELDIHGKMLWTTPDIWALVLIMTCCCGTGLMLINNLGTIIRTLWEYRRLEPASSDLLARAAVTPGVSSPQSVQKLQAAQVSLLSVFNCLGRILAGLISDFAQNRFGVNRVWYLTVLSGLFVVSQVIGLAAVHEPDQVWRLVVVGGLAYGSLFGTVPVLVIEWFGIPHFSTNMGLLNLSPIVSGQAFNLAFGRIYDSHIPLTPPGSPPSERSHICTEGAACYSDALRTTLSACTVAFVFSLAIAYRRQRMRHPLDAIPRWYRRQMETLDGGGTMAKGSMSRASADEGTRASLDCSSRRNRMGKRASLRRSEGLIERARSLSLEGEAGVRPLIDWMAPVQEDAPAQHRSPAAP